MFGECCGGILGAGVGYGRGKEEEKLLVLRRGWVLSGLVRANSVFRTTRRDGEELILVCGCYSSGRGACRRRKGLCRLGSLWVCRQRWLLAERAPDGGVGQSSGREVECRRGQLL